MSYTDALGTEIVTGDFVASAAAPGLLRVGLVVALVPKEVRRYDYEAKGYKIVTEPELQVLRKQVDGFRLGRASNPKNVVRFSPPGEVQEELRAALAARTKA